MRFGTRTCGLWAAVVGLLLSGVARANAPADSLGNDWRFSVTPYIWVPSIGGTLQFTALPGSGNEHVVTIDPIDYFEYLNIPLMIAGSAKKGPWSLATDFFWVDFSGERATVTTIIGPGGVVEVPVDAGSVTGLRGTIWTLSAGYAPVRKRSFTMEILGGFRYFAVKTTLDWRFDAGTRLEPQSGSLSQSDDLWDGIVVLRGDVRFGGGRWLVPFHLDGGAGSSTTTWSAMAGLGYAFGWGDLRLLYRHIQWNAHEASSIQNLQLGGPAFAATFRF